MAKSNNILKYGKLFSVLFLSKSVWEQSHKGSNLSRCAKKISLQAGLRRL